MAVERHRRRARLEKVGEAAELEVVVGWQDPDVAAIARINELGDRAGSGHPPPRPTLGPAIEDARAAIRIHSARAIKAAHRGRDPRRELEKLAGVLEYGLRVAIDRAAPANAPSTVEKKGFDDPLRGDDQTGDRLFEGARAEVRTRRRQRPPR